MLKGLCPLCLLRGNYSPLFSVPQPTLVSTAAEAPLLGCPGSQGLGEQEYEQRCKLHGKLPALR